MTLTPTNIQVAVQKVEEYFLGAEVQTFWSPTGALIIADDEIIEVYESAGTVWVQGLPDRARNWTDITEDILG